VRERGIVCLNVEEREKKKLSKGKGGKIEAIRRVSLSLPGARRPPKGRCLWLRSIRKGGTASERKEDRVHFALFFLRRTPSRKQWR